MTEKKVSVLGINMQKYVYSLNGITGTAGINVLKKITLTPKTANVS